MSMGTRIRAARQAARYSQEALASAVGVTQGSVGHWEHDRSEPSTGKLAALATETGVRFEWLATGRGEMEYHKGVREEPAPYSPLPQDERQLLEHYRKLPTKAKKAMAKAVEAAADLVQIPEERTIDMGGMAGLDQALEQDAKRADGKKRKAG